MEKHANPKLLYGWFVVLRIYIALGIFQPYRDLEAGDNQSLKIQEARPGMEPRSSCSANQELNHSATLLPKLLYYTTSISHLLYSLSYGFPLWRLAIHLVTGGIQHDLQVGYGGELRVVLVIWVVKMLYLCHGKLPVVCTDDRETNKANVQWNENMKELKYYLPVRLLFSECRINSQCTTACYFEFLLNYYSFSII